MAQITENQLQRAVADHIRSRGVAGLVAFHVPNGGYRRPTEAAILKGMGVVAGVSDWILLHAGTFHALELKVGGNKPTDAQDGFLKQVEAQGGKAAWAAGLDAALKQLETWNLLKGKTA